MTSSLVDALNDAQRDAVLAPDGAVLILAGAGSGKTRVITHRVAHLVRERGVPPAAIVAVTFTNKAAHEMMSRIAALLDVARLPPWSAGAPRLGTFHGFCLRLLRTEAVHLGYQPGFVVYDTDDSSALLRECLRELQLDDKVWTPRALLARLGDAKDRLQTPRALLESGADRQTETVAAVYEMYQRRLRQANAMDFDDLIFNVLTLFARHPERARAHALACRHLLVDEFQDTNASQYRLVRALAAAHGNVLVVGDEDQSIYRFRGADIRNILDFTRDYPEARLIRLEKNYRSTRTILAAAGAVVKNNAERYGKTLWTDNDAGEPIGVFRAGTERDEAGWVVERLRALRDQGVPLVEQAVLYRANFQSRPFEDALTRASLPYRIIGSVRFYERREVRDLLSYLRLLHNPDDDVAAVRVLNTPPRGIGPTTLETLDRLRAADRLPLLAAARRAAGDGTLAPRQAAPLSRFLALFDELRAGVGNRPIRRLLEEIMDRVDYVAYLERAEGGSSAARLENLEALATAADEAEAEGGDLAAFLDQTALTAAVDTVEGHGEGGVTLMTLHCAKGLEFPAVFLVGLEERLFPHSRSMESRADLEEERRLFYVGVTRAMRRLFLTHAAMRSTFGRLQVSEPSRFLAEIPPELLREEVSDTSILSALRRGAEGEPRFSRSGRPRPGSFAARAAGRRAAPGSSPDEDVDEDAMAGEFAEEGDLRVGRSVLHGRYGRGTILHREGDGDGLKVTVSVPGFGQKKLVARYARLRMP